MIAVIIVRRYKRCDGSEHFAALKFAAERGVEVVLLLPGIPDKKIPYALAKGHYASLLESGVKIYEYTPGFVHAKVFVSDMREAVVSIIFFILLPIPFAHPRPETMCPLSGWFYNSGAATFTSLPSSFTFHFSFFTVSFVTCLHFARLS